MIKRLRGQKLISSLVNCLLFNFLLFSSSLFSHIFWSWSLINRLFDFVLLGDRIGHVFYLYHGVPRIIVGLQLYKFATIGISQIDVQFLLLLTFCFFLNCYFVR